MKASFTLPPAEFMPVRIFLNASPLETHMGVIISYHFFPADKRNSITICADAGRRNGDYYE